MCLNEKSFFVKMEKRVSAAFSVFGELKAFFFGSESAKWLFVWRGCSILRSSAFQCLLPELWFVGESQDF